MSACIEFQGLEELGEQTPPLPFPFPPPPYDELQKFREKLVDKTCTRDVYIYIHFVSWTFRCFVAATTRGIDSSARRSCGAPPTFGGTGPRSKLVNPPS